MVGVIAEAMTQSSTKHITVFYDSLFCSTCLSGGSAGNEKPQMKRPFLDFSVGLSQLAVCKNLRETFIEK